MYLEGQRNSMGATGWCKLNENGSNFEFSVRILMIHVNIKI